MCSKLKISTAWHRSGVFVVDFDQSQHIDILFLLLTLNKYLSLVCEKQVIIFWKHTKKILCFVINFISPISFNDLSLHWIEIIITILWTYYEHVYVSSLNFLWESQAYHHRFVCYLICYIIALLQRFNLYHCIKPKAYFNHWSSGTNW